MSGSELTPNDPPTVQDIRSDRLTKLWVRCPECGTVHELLPKDAKDCDDIPENVLIDRVLECYLSHDWTPDSWKEAHEKGLVPESWVENPDEQDTDSDTQTENA